MKPRCPIYTYSLIFGLLTSLAGCDSSTVRSTPKPHMYPKIDFPERTTQVMALASCPFDAQIPTYGSIVAREDEYQEEAKHPCWFDIVFETFGATLHCSYYPINDLHDLSSLIEDAYTMASKHNVKANFREEIEIFNSFGASGLLFDIQGPVASPYQFYITDRERHFLRGSLYYDDKIDRDSVAPITIFLKEDVDAFLNTIEFR